MGLIELVQRWWAHRKLSRGRCDWCHTVLPDDNTTGFCCDSCADEQSDAMAW